MLNITTPINPPAVTRMRCLRVDKGFDVVRSDSVVTELKWVKCFVQFRPGAGGLEEDDQQKRHYGSKEYALKITNGNCSTVLFSTSATANPYTDGMVTGSKTVSDGYDQVLAAIQTGNENGIENRVELALSSMGCVPSGT
jgi:hypothetical protein